MSITVISLWLVLSIVVILFAIIKLKLNPALALVLGSLVMGLGCGLGLTETASTIGTGFGNLMAGSGLPIGFGCILGKLLEANGGARVIADTIIRKAGEKYSLYALGFAALILAIPVFFDITFIILIPLALEVSKRLKKPVPYVIGAVAIGASAAHTFIPPTPNPLAAASILNFDLGIMVIVGTITCLVVGTFTMFIYFKLLDHGYWKAETDETGVIEVTEPTPIPEHAPSFGIALIPLLLPVICILLSTVSGAMGIKSPVLSFLSDKTIAMFLGTIAAYIISLKPLGDKLEKYANEAVNACGIVLLITGAGGSFGAIISATGFADVITNTFTSVGASPVVLVIFAYLLAVTFKVALGSGTVAAITTMNIVAGFVGMTSLHPVFLALACLAGGTSIGHINDSGFWVVSNLSGFSVKGGFKVYTFENICLSVSMFVICLVAAIFA